MQCETLPALFSSPLPPFLRSPMEEQANPPIWYNELPINAQSPSHWFQNANGFVIGRSQFMNVQGNMTIRGCRHPTQRRQSTGTIGVMAPGTTSSPQEWATDVVYTESVNYCSQLLSQGRGFPLYVPGPQINLPAEYRTKGVCIGDVGRVTPEGIFDFFFNVYLPADDPVNANDVPEDFSPLLRYAERDVFHLDYDPGNYVSTPSVHEDEPTSEHFPGSEFGFSCVGPKGAVLALPHGAHLEKLENLETLRQYAAKNAESWYKYVNGPQRGRRLVNGALYLVTGCEKSQSWGIASFQDVSPDNEFQLSFRPTAGADAGYQYRWRRGTPARQKHADLSPGSPLNQTIFIHAFTISLGEGIWGKIFRDVEISQLVDSQGPKLGNGFVPFGSQNSSSSWPRSPFGGHTPNGRQSGGGSEQGVVLSDAFPLPQIIHPSQIINSYILRQVPQATVVMTHDDDWCNILRDDKKQGSTNSTSELLEQIFEHFEIVEKEGASYLIAKPGSTPLAIDAASFTPPDVGQTESERSDDILTILLDKDEVEPNDEADASQNIEFSVWAESTELSYSPSSESDGFSGLTSFDGSHYHPSIGNPSRRNSWFQFPDSQNPDDDTFSRSDWNWHGLKNPLLHPNDVALSAVSSRSNSNSSAISSGSVFSPMSTHGFLKRPASAPIQEPTRVGSLREPTLEDLASRAAQSPESSIAENTRRSTDSEAARPFVCNICQDSFTSKHHYTDHMKAHNVSLTHNCNECGSSFSTLTLLKRHQRKGH